MTDALPLPPEYGGGRFEGFDVLRQRIHWDPATRDAVERRLHPGPALRFFTMSEAAVARALVDRLMAQNADQSPYVDVLAMIDARLADDETDGWNYDTLPADPDAWRASIAGLDSDARELHHRGFTECTEDQQRAMIESVRTWATREWRGMPPTQLWSLWTRYAATAFYSHPLVWNEMGFPGPAYPRGYKNIGIDRPEPFEQADSDPRDDPLRREART